MRLCILGDTHFGVRNDSPAFHDLFRKFYEDTFFPYMEEHGIDHILQTGDLFDRRKYVNFNSLNQSREYFFDVVAKRGYVMDVILGNHDIFYKNTLSVNSPELLLGSYQNIHIIKEPVTLQFKGMSIDMIPWICDDNRAQIAEFIRNTNSPYCFGHFELSGFEMDRGNICHAGDDAMELKKYKQVISGHFHHKSESGNILYVGAPCEHTWSDWNDPRGFHTLDTLTGEMEFIPNPHTIFTKLNYNDDELYFDDIQNGDYSQFTGKYIKVIVVKKNNSFLFETLIDNLNKANAHDIIIVEDFSSPDDLGAIEEINQADDTMGIIDKVVDGIEMDLEKPKLKTILREIYTEALALES